MLGRKVKNILYRNDYAFVNVLDTYYFRSCDL